MYISGNLPWKFVQIHKNHWKNPKKCPIASFWWIEHVHHVSKIFFKQWACNNIYTLDSEYHWPTVRSPNATFPVSVIHNRCNVTQSRCCVHGIPWSVDQKQWMLMMKSGYLTLCYLTVTGFANQISVLETVIWEAGHECIFLPGQVSLRTQSDWDGELNFFLIVKHNFISSTYYYSIRDGLNINTGR